MSFGFRFRDASGQVTLSSSGTAMRLVDAVALSHTFSGDVFVPDFDDAKGIFTIVRKVLFTNTEWQRIPDGAALPNRFVIWKSLLPQPTLSWTQADTRLNVTAPAPVLSYQRPSGGTNTVGFAPDYEVRFFHYR